MADYINKNEVLNLIMHNDKVCHYADERYENVVYATTQTICKVVADMEASDVQPVNQWISVKERLPEENQKCLVYRDINADLKITTGIWHSDGKEFYGLRHGTRLEDTIAWMPLLEPPKDGENNGTDNL